MAENTHPASESFYVTISASGRDPQDPSRIIHAISVSQPVQSWTVVREYNDFVDVGNKLLLVNPGLPLCPTIAPLVSSDNTTNNPSDQIVHVRNVLQEWLISVLLFPGARESPALRNFMTFGANQIPQRFEGTIWLHFTNNNNNNTNNSPTKQQQGRSSNTTTNTSTPVAVSPARVIITGTSPSAATRSTATQQQQQHRNTSLDEMEMDFMFDTGGSLGDEEDDEDVASDYDDELIPYAQRYPPPDEVVTQEDVDLMESLGEIEMVEDVGSLAQSLGASHLGRSLQLQAQMTRQHNNNSISTTTTTTGGGGITVGSAAVPTNYSAGGIANAMQKSGGIPGLGDSFYQQRPVSAPRLDSFKMIKVIGKGSFGKVFLVCEKKTGHMFALKVLRKDNIIKRNQVEHTKTERNVLGYVKHPFIVRMNMAFQSNDKLYFVLDYCAGGELFFHLGKLGKFPEPRACFYAAEITLAISYVHKLDIIYRDLKPENVLLDAKGHVRLTDFGLSKEGISNSSSGANSFCGTPEYLAPEILNRQGHGRAVDWWSLGALLYEMLTGLPPFYCRDREKLFEKIRNGVLTYPRYLSSRAQGVLRGLLTRDPTKRLGSGPADAEDIKVHPFFSEINWDKLARGEIPPPFVPIVKNSMDTSQFDNEFTSLPMFSPESYKKQAGFGSTPQDNNMFEGFTFTDKHFYHPNNMNHS